MPGDLRLSKLVIDIFLISENMELVERLLCSPKLMIFETDNFLRSLWDLSHAFDVAVEWFPIELLPLAWLFVLLFGNEGEGDVGLCSNGSDNEDLFLMLPLSSCSAIVAGILLLTLLDVKSVCFSSSFINWGWCCCCISDCELGLIGGVPGETIEMGGTVPSGGEGVGEWFNWWFVSTIDSFEGESGGSDMQIDACWTDNLLSSCSDFCSVDWMKWFDYFNLIENFRQYDIVGLVEN
jgi:hypothetical protein